MLEFMAINDGNRIISLRTGMKDDYFAVDLERWLSGRKRRFAKPLYGLNRIGGSNPPLSAKFHENP